MSFVTMNHKVHFSHTSLQSPAAFNRPSACERPSAYGNVYNHSLLLLQILILQTN